MHDGAQALVVDPGDAAPVVAALRHHQLRLDAILLTHRHPDHIAGVAALRQLGDVTVWGSADEPFPFACTQVHDSQRLQAAGFDFTVLAVPGHTVGHVAYYCEATPDAPVLFCGDTLFSAGCGRLFEGTPEQMLHSLDRLATLPDATKVCCAHEYTLSNLHFAAHVEPDNRDVAAHLHQVQAWRAQGMPSLPSTIGHERRINPFLRSREAAVIEAMQTRNPQATDPVAIWATMRQWKNTCA